VAVGVGVVVGVAVEVGVEVGVCVSGFEVGVAVGVAVAAGGSAVRGVAVGVAVADGGWTAGAGAPPGEPEVCDAGTGVGVGGSGVDVSGDGVVSGVDVPARPAADVTRGSGVGRVGPPPLPDGERF
jgi:hypothetical protein